jgi:dynein heavy chain
LLEEKIRWNEEIEKIEHKQISLLGDMYLAAACIGYYAPYNVAYRRDMKNEWLQLLDAYSIQTSDPFSFRHCLSDELVIYDWHSQNLPTDTSSINNAVIITNCEKWPLIIDP